jgi:hypothetical protein
MMDGGLEQGMSPGREVMGGEGVALREVPEGRIILQLLLEQLLTVNRYPKGSEEVYTV